MTSICFLMLFLETIIQDQTLPNQNHNSCLFKKIVITLSIFLDFQKWRWLLVTFEFYKRWPMTHWAFRMQSFGFSQRSCTRCTERLWYQFSWASETERGRLQFQLDAVNQQRETLDTRISTLEEQRDTLKWRIENQQSSSSGHEDELKKQLVSPRRLYQLTLRIM